MRRRFLIVANQTAGIAGSSLLADVLRQLTAADCAVSTLPPTPVEEVRHRVARAAADGEFDAIVAAGGDSTIRQVAAGLLGSPVPLGLIPVGTANVLAREIGLSARVGDVVAALRDGPTVEVSVPRANGEPFLLMAGAGLDARVLSHLNQRLKTRVGRAAYAGPIVGALVEPVDLLDVRIDGRAVQACWVIVANAAHYAGSFVVAPGMDIAHKGLQAIVFKARTRATLTRQVISLALGRLAERSARQGDVETLPCMRVTIASARPVPAQLDGDLFGTTPLDIAAATDALQLIVPAERGKLA